MTRLLQGRFFAILAAVVLALAAPQTAFAAGPRTAVFPFDLIDDSQEGEVNGVRADQTARLALISAELRKLLAESGRYELVDLAPIAADIAKDSPIYKCNGCDDALANKVNADVAMICTVQKVSNLILNINVFVRDVKAGKVVSAYSVDVRGNTDESWLRSIRYLVKNRLLAEEKSPT